MSEITITIHPLYVVAVVVVLLITRIFTSIAIPLIIDRIDDHIIMKRRKEQDCKTRERLANVTDKDEMERIIRKSMVDKIG